MFSRVYAARIRFESDHRSCAWRAAHVASHCRKQEWLPGPWLSLDLQFCGFLDQAEAGSLLFLPDNFLHSGRLYGVDTTSWQVQTSTRAHQGEIMTLCLSADEGRLFSCGADGRILSWDSITLDTIGFYPGHNELVVDLVCLPLSDGLMVSCDEDRVLVWNSTTLQTLHEIIQPSAACLASSPISPLFVCGFSCSRGLVTVFSADTFEPLWSRPTHCAFRSVAITPSAEHLVLMTSRFVIRQADIVLDGDFPDTRAAGIRSVARTTDIDITDLRSGHTMHRVACDLGVVNFALFLDGRHEFRFIKPCIEGP
eukprot:m.59510 g.59510  ORF g.59510 m.59510 type:complete len:311 (+) comp49255_c0_seq3:364-1296(+)